MQDTEDREEPDSEVEFSGESDGDEADDDPRGGAAVSADADANTGPVLQYANLRV